MKQGGGAAAAGAMAMPFLLLSSFVVLLGGISAAQAPPVGCGAGGGATVADVTLTAEQMGNAQTIVAVAAGRQLPPHAAVVAVATAYQESKLSNILVMLDHDSLGLFQLRVSLWGRATAVDPVASTEWFLDRLVQVPNYQSLPLTQAAQAVQRSAYPDAYARWRPMATGVVSELWPLAAQQADDQGAAAAGPGADPAAPDAVAAAPHCASGAGGTATETIACSTGGGEVVAAPGGAPIRICAAGPYVVDTTLAPGVTAMLADARAAGLDLGGSGFRSNASQIALRRAHCGPSDYDTYDKPSGQCSPPTARPGQSMHEWGLALDISNHGVLIRSRQDPAFQWLQGNAGLYGLRNLPSEPWHWSTNGR